MRNAILISGVMLLTACGGGGSVTPLALEIQTITPPVQTSTNIGTTKVIDGYVSGANVFVDMNWNLTKDPGEPYAYEDTVNEIYYWESDQFSEIDNFTSSCFYNRPRIAEVPVGAYDSDRGHVENAYTMMYYPYEYDSEVEQANVTPFTSLFASFVTDYTTGNNISVSDSCGTLADQIALNVISEIQEVVDQLSNQWNRDIFTFYDDYIASGDAVLQRQGERIVDFMTTIYKVGELLSVNYGTDFHAPIDYELWNAIMNDEEFTTITFDINNSTDFSEDDTWVYYTERNYLNLTATENGTLINSEGEEYAITLENLNQYGNLHISGKIESKEAIFNDIKVIFDMVDGENAIEFGTFENINITRYVQTPVERRFHVGLIQGYTLSIINSSNTYLDYDIEQLASSLNEYTLESLYLEMQDLNVDINNITNNRYMLFDSDAHWISNDPWRYHEQNNSGQEQTCQNVSTGEVWTGNEAYDVCSNNM
jgi:hypothetical protein